MEIRVPGARPGGISEAPQARKQKEPYETEPEFGVLRVLRVNPKP